MVAFISTLHASSGVKDPSKEEVKNEMLKNEVFSKLVLLPEKEKRVNEKEMVKKKFNFI